MKRNSITYLIHGKRTNQTNQHFFLNVVIKFQYQFHHSYKPHMDLFSITIIGFHFNLTDYT